MNTSSIDRKDEDYAYNLSQELNELIQKECIYNNMTIEEKEIRKEREREAREEMNFYADIARYKARWGINDSDTWKKKRSKLPLPGKMRLKLLFYRNIIVSNTSYEIMIWIKDESDKEIKAYLRKSNIDIDEEFDWNSLSLEHIRCKSINLGEIKDILIAINNDKLILSDEFNRIPSLNTQLRDAFDEIMHFSPFSKEHYK